MPLARATGMGSTLDCADHSKSVCFLVRSTISCPVIVGKAVVVVVMSGPNRISFPLWTFVSFVVISCFHYKGHKGTREKQQQRKNESTRICASVPSPSARLRLSFQYRTRLHRGPARA